MANVTNHATRDCPLKNARLRRSRALACSVSVTICRVHLLPNGHTTCSNHRLAEKCLDPSPGHRTILGARVPRFLVQCNESHVWVTGEESLTLCRCSGGVAGTEPAQRRANSLGVKPARESCGGNQFNELRRMATDRSG